MVEITSETYERFNKRFPDPTMSAKEIAAELDHMNPSDAEEYDAVLCNLFGFQKDSVVLLINTEGDTDPEGYARIVQ